jgi:hypothetical protein
MAQRRVIKCARTQSEADDIGAVKPDVFELPPLSNGFHEKLDDVVEELGRETGATVWDDSKPDTANFSRGFGYQRGYRASTT